MTKRTKILSKSGKAGAPEHPACTEDGLIFTPVLPSGARALMRVTKYPEGARGPGYRGTITDNLTGFRWRVYGAPCGGDCYCDATVRRERT